MLDTNFFPFKTIRPEQQFIIDKINANLDKRYFIIEAGTGVGKSGIAIDAAQSDSSGYIITDSIQLQDQYEKDFSTYSLVNMKGKNNYQCIESPKFTCEFGKCSVDDNQFANCVKMHKCPYYEKRMEAQAATIFLTSYAFLLTAAQIPNFLKQRNTLIFDEAHLLEKHLTELFTIDINIDDLEKNYEIMSEADPNEEKFLYKNLTSFNGDYVKYIQTLSDVCSRKYEKENDHFKNEMALLMKGNESDQDLAAILVDGHKKFYTFNQFITGINHYLLSPTDENWIIEQKENSLHIRPLKVDWIYKNNLDNFAKDHVYFMSATILDEHLFCKTFGLDEKDVCFIREESSFDSDKSPIYGICNCQTNYTALQDDNNLANIAAAVNAILKIYPNSKGIIHTGNMKISRYLKYNIDSDRLLVRDGEFTNRIIYNKHIKSKEPTVLVSSSMSEGVDLKDDLSRFQIIVKMPFASLADARVKKLSEQTGWYECNMWRELVQACGRSTRNEDDHCDTYILDASFWKWFNTAKKNNWLTDQFVKRVRKIS